MEVSEGQCSRWRTWLLLMAMAFVCLLESQVDSAAANCPFPTLTNGKVKLQNRSRRARYNCRRGYQLVGEKFSLCLQGRWHPEPPICVSSGCGLIEFSEQGHVLDSYRGALLHFLCNPGYSLVGSLALFCDGRNWNATVPDCEPSVKSPSMQCDFESEDLCGWSHDHGADFEWQRNSLKTPSGHVGTGPSFDHTLGNGTKGHYMYIEASSPREFNDTARLFSPVYQPNASSSDACFVFWYHMFGSTTGSLRVYVKLEKEESKRLVFQKSGNQGDVWLKAVAHLEDFPQPFQIIIEGIRGSSYISDTAIDDVLLTRGQDCVVPTTTSTTTTVATTLLTSDTEPDTSSTMESEESETTEEDDHNSSCEGLCGSRGRLSHHCDCHPECAQEHTCCPDYAKYCVSDWPSPMEPSSTWLTDMEESAETTWITESIPETTGESISSPGEAVTSTEKPTVNTVEATTSTQTTVQSTTPMKTTLNASTTPVAVTTISSSTTHRTTTVAQLTTTVARLTTTVARLTTTEKTTQRTTTASTSTNAPTTTTTTAVPVPPPNTTTPTEATSVRTEPTTTSTVQSSTTGSDEVEVQAEWSVSPVAIGLAGGLTLAFLVAISILAIHIHRRRRLAETTQQRRLPDDSDVRFLTQPDMELDFTLARPLMMGDSDL